MCHVLQDRKVKMRKYHTFVQLKEMMFAMEQSLGLGEMTEAEKCVFSCIIQATGVDSPISTKTIEKHLLTSKFSRPTVFRAIKSLLKQGVILQHSRGKYLAVI